jgi:WD40 repeat protein
MQKVTTPLHDWKFAGALIDNRISWSADGRTLAVLPENEASDAPDSIVHMINDQQSATVDYSNKSVTDPFNQPSYSNLAWSPVENLLAVSTFEKMDIGLWQRGHTNGPVRSLQNVSVAADPNAAILDMQNVAWSRDGSMLAGIRDDFKVTVWQVKSGKILQTLVLPGHGGNGSVLIRRSVIDWSPQAQNQLVTGNLLVANVFDVATNKILHSFSTDDRTALTALKDTNTARYYAPEANGLAWSPNGRYIAGSYEFSHQVYIWDTQNKTPKTTKEGYHIQDMLFGENNGHFNHKACTIIDLAWSPDGRYLATASNDTTVIIWKMDGS